MKNKRLAFARKYLEYTEADWDTVVFADESNFNRLGNDGRQWTYVRDGKAPREYNYTRVKKFGGGNVKVWACITSRGPGYMCRIDGNMDTDLFLKIMDEDFMDSLDWYSMDLDDIELLQDSDPKHTSKKSMEWYKTKGLQLLDWPTNSPDLNPIENVWAHVKKMLARYLTEPAGVKELWQRLSKEWDTDEVKDLCKKVIHSMPRRLQAVIDAKGDITKY